jgi:hypothetical protein
MALSTEEYNRRVDAWLGVKWPTPRTCPICQVVPRRWIISLPAEIAAMPEGDGEVRKFVLIPVMCSNCCYEVNFNSQAMQLFSEGFDMILNAPS